MDAIIADEMKPLYLSNSAKTESILALCMTMARDLGSSVFIDQSRALLERIDQCDTLRAISVPCLILCGADDELCPVEKHQMMAELISGARLRIIDKAGHLPPLEAPHLVTEALTDWLGAC
jgi:pimeloyl-ACP methyl ester carboxylesterase